MTQYREKQGELLTSDESRVSFLFESGIDAWKKDGSSLQRGESDGTERPAGSGRWTGPGGPPGGAVPMPPDTGKGGRGACTTADIRRPFDALANSGIPWLALDASLVKARMLDREGQPGEALELESLVDDLLFFRQKLPGVLGAWYLAEQKEKFFSSTWKPRPPDPMAEQTLVALDRVRLVDRPGTSAERRGSYGHCWRAANQRPDRNLPGWPNVQMRNGGIERRGFTADQATDAKS